MIPSHHKMREQIVRRRDRAGDGLPGRKTRDASPILRVTKKRPSILIEWRMIAGHTRDRPRRSIYVDPRVM